jgi:hypothetical protein
MNQAEHVLWQRKREHGATGIVARLAIGTCGKVFTRVREWRRSACLHFSTTVHSSAEQPTPRPCAAVYGNFGENSKSKQTIFSTVRLGLYLFLYATLRLASSHVRSTTPTVFTPMQTALGPLSPQLRITCALTLFLPLRFE